MCVNVNPKCPSVLKNMFRVQAVDMWSLLSSLLQRVFVLDCACQDSKNKDFGDMFIYCSS